MVEDVMPTLQLRLSHTETLRGLVDELSSHLCDVLARHDTRGRMRAEDLRLVAYMLWDLLVSKVRAYGVCGSRMGCHINLKSVVRKSLEDMDRWIPYCPPDRQRILLFDVNEDLPNFYMDIEGALFDVFFRGIPARYWLPLKNDLDAVLRKTFTPYLYENPACEACVRCTPETRIDPRAAVPEREFETSR